MKQKSPPFFPVSFSRVTDEAGTCSLLLLPYENNVLLAHRVCISAMGHRWVHFIDLNKGIFDRPANIGLSWSQHRVELGDGSFVPLSEERPCACAVWHSVFNPVRYVFLKRVVPTSLF